VDDYTLVIDASASSVKFCVYRRPDVGSWRPDARGQITGIGSSPRFSVSDETTARSIERDLEQNADTRSATESLASWVRATYGVAHLLGVGHRVAHGGLQFRAPVLIRPQVLEALRSLAPLAPLHQPHNLAAIEAIAEHLPGVPQVACFDTSFHRSQPAIAEAVPLPREIRETGVQWYGFHGLSHEYVASVLPQTAPEIAAGRVVVAHLGDDDASLCAMENRKSVDVETILYGQSGRHGLSGVGDDMRELLESGELSARLDVDDFVYRVAKEIGALAAVLGGIDGLVFTASIGESSAELRRRVSEASEWLGIALDPDANRAGGPRISRSHSRVSVWRIPTNEELAIARHTAVLLGLVETHV
jgi:acetate kinase